MSSSTRPSLDQSGQTLFEYVLLLLTVVGSFLLVQRGLKTFDLQKKLMTPLSEEFAMSYKYGHPKAKGLDEGKVQNHPRLQCSNNCDRLFINPRAL